MEAVNASKTRFDSTYTPGARYDRIVGEPTDRPVSIDAERFFSVAGWERQKAAIMAYDRAKKRYDEERNEHQRLSNLRNEVREEIDERVARVRRAAAHRKNLIDGFEPYVELADGDRTVAMRFYRRASFIPDEIVEQLVPDFFGTPDAADEAAKPAPELDEG